MMLMIGMLRLIYDKMNQRQAGAVARDCRCAKDPQRPQAREVRPELALGLRGDCTGLAVVQRRRNCRQVRG
jgi:hypothetical protein